MAVRKAVEKVVEKDIQPEFVEVELVRDVDSKVHTVYLQSGSVEFVDGKAKVYKKEILDELKKLNLIK